MATPRKLDVEARVKSMKSRVEKCWKDDIKWELYPLKLKEECEQLGKAFDMPATAVLSGLLLLISHCLSHCVVKVPGTSWNEPLLIWLTICMPTGSGKTPLFTFLNDLIKRVRSSLKLTETDPVWCLDEASFEMMGFLMARNKNRLLGLYDEFSTFLSQVNVYRGKGLCESHDLATLLSLYNAKSWNRDTVSGEANFHMDRTGLTLGGFTQPSVAANLVELPQSQEKGLAQRFLWIVPKPSYAKFGTLKPVNEEFCEYLVQRLMHIKKNDSMASFMLPEDCENFATIYDDLQGKLEQVSVTDELLAGLLSKAKGQILRVAACIHVLVADYKDHEKDEHFKPESKPVPTEISNYAITAAENFVMTCCQHCSFLSGRGDISKEIKRCAELSEGSDDGGNVISAAAFTILQPGKILDLSAMLKAKKYSARGNKDGAIKAMKKLQSDGFGMLKKKDMQRGAAAVYQFEKSAVPDTQTEKQEFAKKLTVYGVSLSEYCQSLEEATCSTKRSSESDIGTTPNKSPRLHVD